MPRNVAVLGLFVIVVSTCIIVHAFAQKNSHPGNIVDAYKRNGIEADAYAYNSQNQTKNGDCPTYAGQIDGEKSSAPTGDFAFLIDVQTNSYLAVYCKQGYASRTETINDNRTDNTRVQPDPITLYPISGGANVAQGAISADVLALQLNLKYYKGADSKSFASAMKSSRFSDQDRQILDTLSPNRDSDRDQDRRWPRSEMIWRPMQKNIYDSQTAFVAIATDLNHARSDFRYYANADPSGFSAALSTFDERLRDTIEQIRNRPKPFGSLQ